MRKPHSLVDEAPLTGASTSIATVFDGPAEVPYPSPPWRLGGRLVASLFLVAADRVPDRALEHVPAGLRPLRLRGRLLVGAAFAQYTPGSVLDYNELLVVLPVRSQRRVALTIPDIWVDSEASRSGGRTLWGIPKELAWFSASQADDVIKFTASDRGRPIASACVVPRFSLNPWWQAFPLTTEQRTAAGAVIARNLIVSKARAASADWSFNPDGRLGYLASGRQLGSIALTEMTVTFGISAETVSA